MHVLVKVSRAFRAIDKLDEALADKDKAQFHSSIKRLSDLRRHSLESCTSISQNYTIVEIFVNPPACYNDKDSSLEFMRFLFIQ